NGLTFQLVTETLKADLARIALHHLVVMQRLPVRDISPVLIFFLDLAPDIYVRGIFCELKNIRAKEAQPVLDRILQCADRGHHGDDGENADRDSDHRQGSAQLVGAQRRQRHLNNLAEQHLDSQSISPQRSRRTQSYNETSSGAFKGDISQAQLATEAHLIC